MNSGRRNSPRALSVFSLLCSETVLPKPTLPSLPVRPGVGRHNDDRVLKVDHAPLCVGDAPVVEDLQQDVQHVGMRLFQLVKEDDANTGVRRIFSVSCPASS